MSRGCDGAARGPSWADDSPEPPAEHIVIRAFSTADLTLEHRPLNGLRNISGKVTTAVQGLGVEGDMEVGIWEHSVGISSDVEVEEIFVVLAGRGRVTCDEGGIIDLAPGVVGMLPSGARTTWEITEPLRKVWIVQTS